MKKILNLLVCFLLLNVSTDSTASQSTIAPLEKVSLQLKWLHQFQFAGYYAAKAQGYYAAEGLDVDFFERSRDTNVVQQIVSGAMNFAVSDTSIIPIGVRDSLHSTFKQ